MEKETPAPPVVQPSSVPIPIAKLQGALAKAQGEFPVIPKDSEVEVKSKEGKLLYKYKYADLTTIISCTRPAMSAAGLSFTQGVVPGGFVTTIMHESGEQLRTGFVPCEVPKNADMKQVAGLITYVKRISLTAALGVSADEDVDAGPIEGNQGNSTSKGPAGKVATPAKQQPPAKASAPPQNAPATKDMMDQMLDLMINRVAENSINTLITKGYGLKNTNSIPTWVWQEIMDVLSNEDCNDKMIERKYNEVVKRREAKAKGG
jgi:hypothetical protein